MIAVCVAGGSIADLVLSRLLAVDRDRALPSSEEDRLEPIAQFDIVRVVRIVGAPDSHLALSTSARTPKIGDTGTVVDLLRDDGYTGASPDAPSRRYLVERVAADGRTVWLAEFTRDELLPISKH